MRITPCSRYVRVFRATELLQAIAETMAAKEAAARLEGEVAAVRTGGRAGGSIDSHGKLHADWDISPRP